jgi:hypothetical protein
MHEVTFKITFAGHLRQLTWMLSIYGILLTIYFCCYGWRFPGPYPYIFLVIFLLDILPTLVVHVQYWLANRNSVLTISKELHQLTYSDKFQMLSYSLDDIIKLLHVASFGGGSWYSFSEYRYFRITFSDGKEIVITSLMVKDVKYVLEMLLGYKADKKLRAVAFIRRNG